MKIKVKLFNPNCRFESIKKGDWIDLKSSITVHLEAPYANTLSNGRKSRNVVFSETRIPLGIGMQLPKGMEALILPRSSTYDSFGTIQKNHEGVVDNSYSGPNDEWKYGVIAMKESFIQEGDKICQFRIQPSQKATIWQKIKWLFTNKITFEFVDNYEGEDRGGFGSTGNK